MVPRLYCDGWGLISEIAFDDSGDDWSSWLEIFVTSGTNIGGSRLYVRGHLISHDFEHALTFPDINVEVGDYLIVEFNVTHGHSHQVDTEPRVFYSTYPDTDNNQPFGSQGAVYITETDGNTWVDAILFIAERASTFNMKDKYAIAVSEGHWEPEAEPGWDEEDYRDALPSQPGSTASSGMSLQRKNDPWQGHPIDTNTKDDWEFRPTTRGYGYFQIDADENSLTVSNSPFYPYVGNPDRAEIQVQNLEDRTMLGTVQIFDVNGYSVKKLMDYREMESLTKENFTWNGEDDYGNILPMGIYIVHLKFEPVNEGNTVTSQDVVVIGRRF